MDKHTSFPKNKLKITLLEKIHPAAVKVFEDRGYSVQTVPRALQGEELTTLLHDAHVIGVRSRTQVHREVLQSARKLLVVGCFTVGTDQVDLDAATTHGVPVFNAPHSSTRSVAELTLGNIIGLARRLGDKSARLHQGRWDKNATGSVEVRNKTVGIIGYGHIGQQVGLLCEALGMNVVFFDTSKKLPLGRAVLLDSQADVLRLADFVTMHVPSSPKNVNLIDAAQLALMKPGSYLLNLSRGNVVDIKALAEGLRSGKLSGAAIDVFPEEPASNDDVFENPFDGLDNVLLTPHIGGSTEEAQLNIGREVAHSLIDFIEAGTTAGAVNFPCIQLPPLPNSHRILNIHKNVPGVLSDINAVISKLGANIDAQYLSTYKDVGYLIMDINRGLSEEVRESIASLPHNIRTRILF